MQCVEENHNGRNFKLVDTLFILVDVANSTERTCQIARNRKNECLVRTEMKNAALIVTHRIILELLEVFVDNAMETNSEIVEHSFQILAIQTGSNLLRLQRQKSAHSDARLYQFNLNNHSIFNSSFQYSIYLISKYKRLSFNI